ncbi:MAG: response regulator [Alphaproteobacteria bacterium]|nr:response regulator [Alphaproteobacteria bacterium]
MTGQGTMETLQTLQPAQLKKLRVLIIDPNVFMRNVIADSLRRLHVSHISSYANAAQAGSSGRMFKPDLVIVDWDAGRISGLEFTREVRREVTGLPRDIPIILLAAEIDHEQLMASRQAGINEFLLKPISAQGILTRVEEVILRPRRFIDSRSYIGPCRRRRDEPGYLGPWRRLLDDPPSTELSATARENAIRLRAIIEDLQAFANGTALDIDYPHQMTEKALLDRASSIRGMYRLLGEYEEEVRSFGDDIVLRVWKAALRYIEGVGMTDTYDVEVIRHHFQTITVILDMPQAALLHRNAVAAELERLVSRKIHQSQRSGGVEVA